MIRSAVIRRRRGYRGGGYGGGGVAPPSPLQLVGTPGDTTLYRSDVGFSAGDWALGEGPGATGVIAAGGDGDFTFAHSDNGVSYTRYLSALAARSTQLVQAEFKGTFTAGEDFDDIGICARHEASASTPALIRNNHDTNALGTTKHLLQELTTAWGVGGFSNSNLGHQLESETWGFSSLGVAGAAVKGYTDIISASTLTGTATGPGTGHAGLWFRSSAAASYPYTLHIRNYFVFSSQLITVTGLSGGRIARLRDSGGSTLAEATESAGTAVIDAVVCRAWAIADLAIYESDGTTLVAASDTQPWPGETWDLTS